VDKGAGGRIGRSTPPTTPLSRGRRLASTTSGTDWMCPPSIPTAISWSSSSSETRRRKSRAAARRETVALLSMRAATACRSASVGCRLGESRKWATLGDRGRGFTPTAERRTAPLLDASAAGQFADGACCRTCWPESCAWSFTSPAAERASSLTVPAASAAESLTDWTACCAGSCRMSFTSASA
jgi:hypothetical protein